MLGSLPKKQPTVSWAERLLCKATALWLRLSNSIIRVQRARFGLSRTGVFHKEIMSSLDYLDLCRLCLVKDQVGRPIFDGEGQVRQIYLKIAACLPVKVSQLRHVLLGRHLDESWYFQNIIIFQHISCFFFLIFNFYSCKKISSLILNILLNIMDLIFLCKLFLVYYQFSAIFFILRLDAAEDLLRISLPRFFFFPLI